MIQPPVTNPWLSMGIPIVSHRPIIASPVGLVVRLIRIKPRMKLASMIYLHGWGMGLVIGDFHWVCLVSL